MATVNCCAAGLGFTAPENVRAGSYHGSYIYRRQSESLAKPGQQIIQIRKASAVKDLDHEMGI